MQSSRPGALQVTHSSRDCHRQIREPFRLTVGLAFTELYIKRWPGRGSVLWSAWGGRLKLEASCSERPQSVESYGEQKEMNLSNASTVNPAPQPRSHLPRLALDLSASPVQYPHPISQQHAIGRVVNGVSTTVVSNRTSVPTPPDSPDWP
jgi:hypothetical protein